MNDINSCQNKTFSNQENYDYIIDNPTPNTFGSIYQNDIISKNINLNKQKYTMNNDVEIIYNNRTSNIQPNYQTTTKIYQSKIPKAIMGNNLNRISTNIKYAQNQEPIVITVVTANDLGDFAKFFNIIDICQIPEETF